jgi:4'-phosphopantetheinyl transferase EntD
MCIQPETSDIAMQTYLPTNRTAGNNAEIISRILPLEVASAEQIGSINGSLLPSEVIALGCSASSRREEFASGRTCARYALEILGLPAQPILRGTTREPIWPVGVVGSITHCPGYCAAAVAKSGRIVSLGIDAEPNQALPDGLINEIAREEEISFAKSFGRTNMNWDRLLFSAKESIYKAWFPIMRSWLDFKEARVVIEPDQGIFFVEIIPTHPVNMHLIEGVRFHGRYCFVRGYVMTSVVMSL